MSDVIAGPALVRLLVNMRVELASARESLNALNVFPVPDGDTGTNLLATFDAGLARASEVDDPTNAHELRAAFLEGMTRAACGNSGVILAEYFRGLMKELVWYETGWGYDGDALARALHAGAHTARQSVEAAAEGTALTVADAAAAGAAAARSTASSRSGQPGVDEVAFAALEAATAALKRTPGQLDVLADAGVVDAGGAGLVILLECLHRATTGRFGLPTAANRSWLGQRPQTSRPALVDTSSCRVTIDGPAFELMAVIEGLADDGALSLRHELAALGESIVVAGGDRVHRLHVHTDDVMAAATLARRFGPMSEPRVTRFNGPVEDCQTIEVRCQDDLVREWAKALGARVGAKGDSSEQVRLLADSADVVKNNERERLVAPPAVVNVVEFLDAMAHEVEPGELEVFQASTWGAALPLVRRALGAAERAVVLVSPDASASQRSAVTQAIDEAVDAAGMFAPDVALLVVESGHCVQIGRE